MTREEQLAELLAEGLDLCVRARNLDEDAVRAGMRKFVGEEMAEQWPEVYGRSGTPHLWVLDQYETDLADWESRARAALS